MKRIFKTCLIVTMLIAAVPTLFAQYGANLLTNPGAEDGDGYDGWTKSGSWALDWLTPHSGSHCWSTSTAWASLVQTVTLTDGGYATGWLDTEPEIYVGAYLATRFDHGGKYEVKAELLNGSDGVVDTWTTGEITLGQGVDWFEVSHTFSSYGTGIRKVRLTLRGEDGTPDWGGYYGTSFDDAFVQINESSLSVGLYQVSVSEKAGAAVVSWTTASETDNLGFILDRSEDGAFWTTIASYQTQEALKGQGNTSSLTEYVFIDHTVEPDKTYWYRLSDVDQNGKITQHAPLTLTMTETPKTTTMENAYPNPFNPQTYIAYHLAGASQVTITVLDMLGRSVKTLYDDQQAAGYYHIYWDGTDNAGNQAASGSYVIRMQAGETIEVQKVMLLK